MLKEKNRVLRRAQLFTDLAVTAASFFLAYYLRRFSFLPLAKINPISYYLFLLYMILPLWALLLHHYRAYSSIRTLDPLQVVLPALKTVLTGAFLLMGILFVFKIQTISRALILFFLSINAIALTAERIAAYLLLHYLRRRGRNYRTVLIAGTGPRAVELARLIRRNRGWGLKIIGYLDAEPSMVGRKLDGGEVVGTFDQLQEILLSSQVDEVIFVVPRSWLDRIEESVLLCETLGIKASIAADFYPHKIANIWIEDLSDWPLLTFSPTSRLDEVQAIKRVLDIAISLTFLIPAAPVLLFIGLLVKLTSPGPVFFKQRRSGMNGRVFNMLKFRTMVKDADTMKGELMHLNEVSGPVFKIKNDPRITRLGRMLRKYSLDELPQFINVLKGDMSIVGPRPPIPSEVDDYDIWQRRRLSIRPGITCLWQVGGRNRLDFDNWVKLDLEYIDNWSWTLDFKIMLRTIPAVILGTGA
jgi:exopolysaccharide biosynthesis polyprenyl glycosylphosphotransferase